MVTVFVFTWKDDTLSVSVAFDRWEPGAVEVFVTVIYSGKTVHEGKLSLDDGPSGF